jgi:Tfp pilus assembly protein PilE
MPCTRVAASLSPIDIIGAVKAFVVITVLAVLAYPIWMGLVKTLAVIAVLAVLVYPIWEAAFVSHKHLPRWKAMLIGTIDLLCSVIGL